jgi:hypothetical protein
LEEKGIFIDLIDLSLSFRESFVFVTAISRKLKVNFAKKKREFRENVCEKTKATIFACSAAL